MNESKAPVMRRPEPWAKVVIYSEGVCTMSCCSALSEEATVAWVNRNHPTGITSPWSISKEDFKDGQENGKPCEEHAGRHHYLLEC